ncbi:hypothetical protein GCM10023172_25210 [Hymenobacter ginsengisoli]|uniref:Uncharacterized protein n=1 Tax=Hymenobacter ginsengisoli TaxID=1051626 RepID=A0ABP8QGR1_9BACT|nr:MULTISPECIES: hypothetical protein [unclassified Hymenobacter]MBO2030220.1 hypothetical protein [Hymenobacter sp. BT559]
MKLSHFLLAAGLCSFTAASAQTTPAAAGTAPGPRGSTTASPSAVPSGVLPPASDPKGAVSPSEVFTAGAPTGTTSDRRAMKRKTHKSSMGKGKMKTKM